ncbi:ABC transporter permease [Serinibacter arcticus]|uniref:ABC transporter permease n=1 Tax=Serinibacter arcticus TaxID=1655435 RepID=A0A2U1ZSM2_9MICO|nr:ABC transporter permease [Serinibacter arcticus]PWD49922.1 ABC transporter permease [Serinibacter arcticus]
MTTMTSKPATARWRGSTAGRAGTPIAWGALARRVGTATAVLTVSLTLLILTWAATSAAFGLPFLFPGPGDVAQAFVSAVENGKLLTAVQASLGRIAAGFAIGCSLGIVLGLVLGASPVLREVASPLVTFFRFVPPLAWFAPALVLFGAGEASMIALIVYTSVFVVAMSTLEGGARVSLDLQRMAGVAGASWWQRLAWVTLPASLPYVFAGMRIAMGNAFMTVVSAEMLGASAGLGVIVNTGMISTRIPDVFVAIAALGILGLAFDRLFVLLINTVGRRFREQAGSAVA